MKFNISQSLLVLIISLVVFIICQLKNIFSKNQDRKSHNENVPLKKTEPLLKTNEIYNNKKTKKIIEIITDNEEIDEIAEITDNKHTLDIEQQHTFNLMENTDDNFFITGKAGTGKSFLLKYFVDNTQKKVLKVSPTGISALNIGGDTIHSVFGYKNISITNLEDINEYRLALNDKKN